MEEVVPEVPLGYADCVPFRRRARGYPFRQYCRLNVGVLDLLEVLMKLTFSRLLR